MFTWPLTFTTEISNTEACETLKGVKASVVGFEIGVTVIATAALLAEKEIAVAGVLDVAARFADVEEGKTATTRALGTFPVQRLPP
jgi:hypothetical protein